MNRPCVTFEKHSSMSPLLLALAGVLLVSISALGQTEQVLYRFSGTPDGSNPWTTLARDAKGNLYGTTNSGGEYGLGTIFQVTPKGVEKILYSFTGAADGGGPQSGVILDSEGNLYGTSGAAVYQLTAGGVFHVLYSFQGDASDVALTRDESGNLYGVAGVGKFSAGDVFEITSTGTEKVLYNFTGGADGGYPEGGLVRIGTTLYGTTNGGGAGYGTVFKLTVTGKETVLHTFAGGADGARPEGNLITDSKGSLYGTTFNGGTSTGGAECLQLGCGTIYKVTLAGEHSVIYNFMGGNDAEYPTSGLALDSSGNLYGTTPYGGSSSCGGCGAVFEVSPSGQETLLYVLPGGAQGANPVGGVIRDWDGNLYGTAFFGGIPLCSSGCGVVFKLTP